MDDKFESLEGGRYSEDEREEERGEKSKKEIYYKYFYCNIIVQFSI